MRYAVISDVHANLEALKAVLAKIDAKGVDETVCLGDLVGYFANPNECVDIIRRRNIKCIMGNHDRAALGEKEPTQFGEAARRAIYWTREHATPDTLEYLAKLPTLEILDRDFLMVHAALHPQPNEDLRLYARVNVERTFHKLIEDHPGMSGCFFGHIHTCVVHEYRDGRLSKAAGPVVRLDVTARYLVNPGSVGQPRDGDPRAAFLIFDADQRTIKFHRVLYDWAASYEKAGRAGLIYKENALRKSINWLSDWVEAGTDAIKRRLPK
ncbi:MAG TPA: metallophosphoesterase family protein [Blastocatellia bacterium]|nr:metallophosphoesterase family protein [Blastocatellia bacterium]